MAEQTQETTPEAVEHVINIRLPDVITGGVYEVYTEGYNEYKTKKPSGNLTIARFYGACALYASKHVFVSGYQPLTDALQGRDHKSIPAEMLGWIEDEIAIPVETSVMRPLAVSLRLLWPTDKIRINDHALSPLPDISKPEITT